MGKLVRDLVPTIMQADGKQPQTRILGDDEYLASLLDKLVEESVELRSAPADARLEELADIYEVLTALLPMLGCNLNEVAAAADAKRAARGAFKTRTWLEHG